MARAPLLASIGCAVLLAAATVPAQQDDAAAVALFERGVAEMLEGRYEHACPTLREAHRLRPKSGTLFTLADCEAKWGKLASAEAHFQEYLRLTERMSVDERTAQGRRIEVAMARVRDLADQVPRLTLVLPEAAPSATVVQRDGVGLGRASLGVPLPVDPGEHLLSTTAPGGVEVRQRVQLAVGEHKTITLEVRPASAPHPTSGGTGWSERPRDSGPPAARRAVTYVIGGVGIAGLIVGAVAGGLTFAQKDTIEQYCDEDGTCTHTDGEEAGDRAKAFALASTIGFGVGVAALGTAIVLWATEPRAPSSRAAPPTARSVAVKLAASPAGLRAGVGVEF